MATLPSEPPTNPGASTHYPAFRAFVESHRDELTNALLADLMQQAPYYQHLSHEQGVERVRHIIDYYLAGLEQPHVATVNAEQVRSLSAAGLDHNMALQLASIYHKHLLNVILQARDAGIEGASDLIRALMTLSDTNARALAQLYEERLRIFRTLITNSPDGIGVSSLDGVLTYANPSFHSILGYQDGLVGNHYNLYVANDDPSIVEELVTNGSWDGVTTFRRKDGSTFRGNSTLFLIMGPDGQPHAMGGVIRDVTQQLQDEEEIKAQAHELRTFFALAENAPDAVIVADATGVITYSNAAMNQLLGDGKSLKGVQVLTLISASQETFAGIAEQITSTGTWSGELDYVQPDGSLVRCQASSFVIVGSDGTAVIASIIRDVTSQRRAEEERLELQQQVIEAQQTALRELSTPLIPISDGLVAMPLVGSIDSNRAQQIVEELLQGVTTNRAQTAIIDITGVPLVDTQVAGALVRAAQAVELLGAQVLLTGIRPEVAQTLVGIGVNLGSIITRSTLQDGITYALAQRGR